MAYPPVGQCKSFQEAFRFAMKTSSKRNLPSIANIEAFLSVARLRSITAASEELFLTQGAVSKQVIELEKYVGKSLFARSPQGLQPTAAGQMLFNRLSPLIADVADAFAGARGQSRAVLNVSVLPTFGMEIITPNLSEFLEMNPSLLVNLYSRLGEVDLDHEGLDAAVIAGAPRPGPYRSEPLFTPDLYPYVSPALLKGGVADLRLLGQHKLIGLVTEPAAWTTYFALLGLPFSADRVATNHSLLSTTAQAVMSGHGIALLPEYLAGQHVRSGLIVRVGDVPFRGATSYHLICRRQVADSEVFTRFREWLVRLLASMGYVPETT